MKFYLKLILIYILRVVLKVFYIFPIKRNRILFSSYEGMSYNCNPKYIFQYLFEIEHAKLDYIWCINDPLKIPYKYKPAVKTVKFLSFKHVFYLITSKVIVSNVGIEPFVPLRKKQVFINTWHGSGAYKKVNLNLDIYSNAQKAYMKKIWKIRSKETTYVLSGCKSFSKVSSRDFGIPIDRFLDTGMPRNDNLFNSDPEQVKLLREEFCDEYKINSKDLLVLYAPTFRGSHTHQKQVEANVLNKDVSHAFEKKFGRPVTFLMRSHHSKSANNQATINGVNVTDYPDMQLLLQVCDILITDYSSSMWDYSLLNKDAFLFVPDLNKYQKDIGFYTPIEDWPFEYAETIPQFCDIILNSTNDKRIKKIHHHLQLLGSYESGEACRKVCKRIINIIDK